MIATIKTTVKITKILLKIEIE